MKVFIKFISVSVLLLIGLFIGCVLAFSLAYQYMLHFDNKTAESSSVYVTEHVNGEPVPYHFDLGASTVEDGYIDYQPAAGRNVYQMQPNPTALNELTSVEVTNPAPAWTIK